MENDNNKTSLLSSFFILITLISIISGCSSNQSEPAAKTSAPSISITFPQNKSELNINLIKLTGIVSDAKAIVTINGNEASVNEDGTYYAFIELSPGENTIEAVASCYNQTSLHSIKVRFIPPLVVNLTTTSIDDDVDYTINPIKVSGQVSNPAALVTVNGSPAQVSENGRYSAYVQLEKEFTNIEAVATLGQQKDSWRIIVGVNSEGKIITVPGLGSGTHIYEPRVIHEESISLKPGETKTMDVTLNTGKKLPFYYPHEFRYEIDVPLLAGGNLSATIEPQRFTAYANTTYHSTFTIVTTDEVSPGEYAVQIRHYGSMIGTTHINVNVVP